MNAFQFILQGDVISKSVAILLLLMSVASWVVILLKAWTLRRASGDVARSTAAFWQSASVESGLLQATAFDRSSLVSPLISASQTINSAGKGGISTVFKLAQAGDKAQQLTRVLRDALHSIINQLNFGQVLLATVGSTAPFVGLLGTVWGIYHALTSISGAGQMTIAQVSGPVGEALVMTAAGLVVAIPAVLAYNVFGRIIGRIEADLEGFASDLRELMSHH
ncbi:MAG: MotA/TolQ/ExbB proton channel family protein [Burkholderiaceae bacterium]